MLDERRHERRPGMDQRRFRRARSAQSWRARLWLGREGLDSRATRRCHLDRARRHRHAAAVNGIALGWMGWGMVLDSWIVAKRATRWFEARADYALQID